MTHLGKEILKLILENELIIWYSFVQTMDKKITNYNNDELIKDFKRYLKLKAFQ
jgi:hypothetical protein